MTNEEKVDILVSNYYINESDSPEGARGVRYGAEIMGEWKDHQVREILRKRWKESQANPNDKELKIALFDEIMDIFLGED